MAPGALRDALRGLGAVAQETEHHVDVFYAHPDRDVVTSDEALRYRRVGERHFLTHKGARLPGNRKAREEVELSIGSDPTDLLEKLGWTPAASLEKVREPWRLGDATVCIDSLDGLGTFAEVEVLDDDLEAASMRVEELVAQLGLEGAERLTTSYLELAARAGVDVS